MESCSTSSSSNTTNKNQWRAEEAIAGNAKALQALRRLIILPLLFSREAKKLGIRVTKTPSFPILSTCYQFYVVPFHFGFWDLILSCLVSGFSVFFQWWPRGLLLYGPPGTGKVLAFLLYKCLYLFTSLFGVSQLVELLIFVINM